MWRAGVIANVAQALGQVNSDSGGFRSVGGFKGDPCGVGHLCPSQGLFRYATRVASRKHAEGLGRHHLRIPIGLQLNVERGQSITKGMGGITRENTLSARDDEGGVDMGGRNDSIGQGHVGQALEGRKKGSPEKVAVEMKQGFGREGVLSVREYCAVLVLNVPDAAA